MSGDTLLSVAEARTRILANVAKDRPIEAVALEHASGRTLARDLEAKRTQPPKAMSAMDGYAVRADDLSQLPVKLKLIGESTAGHGFQGSIGPKETVRIFTGAPVPFGCDTILIQENARVEAGFVAPLEPVARGRNIRAKGIDFAEGEVLLAAGTRLGPSNISLAAAMNYAEVAVVRRPRVGILATGDELVRPGETLAPIKSLPRIPTRSPRSSRPRAANRSISASPGTSWAPSRKASARRGPPPPIFW